MSGGYKELKVYQMAFAAAMGIFEVSRNFPKEEKYSLTDQIRRSSRSVCANIGEGYRKRIYPKHFTSKMSDADGETSETIVWLDFSLSCRYIEQSFYERKVLEYEEIGKMLSAMIKFPEKWVPKNY